MEHFSIRSMNSADLDFAEQCIRDEGWLSENRPTLEGFYLHDAEGCLLAEVDGLPVGICTATPYGKSGFIGELIVRKEARGAGIGAALLNHGVRYLQSQGVETVYLDGVVKAVGLYERNGFRKICRSLRFSGQLEGSFHADVHPMQTGDLSAVGSLDQRMFGADRGFFLARRLELFPELCKVMVGDKEEVTGYILGRRGDGWISAGPWIISEIVVDPLPLLQSFALAVGNLPFSIGILELNRRAVELIGSLGFQERPDCPWRMALGPSSNLGASPFCMAVGTAAKG
jgi:ribosomal protein S18 acetylase RimI-like enzyme